MRWIIAGGGTGGHLYPGMAIAEAFAEKEEGNEVLFIGTERGIEARVIPESPFELRTIQAMPLQGRSLGLKAKALVTLPRAVGEAGSILRAFQPHLVLGVGGYASGPAIVAAFLLGTKRAIHEQNLVPGMTNRLLKRFSQKIFVAFEETRKYFPEKKTVLSGTPVRKTILACGERKDLGRRGPFTVFIVGGSAGAHRINVAMMDALDSLQGNMSGLKFIHQTGREDFSFVLQGYEERGVDALVKPFFDEMASYYRLSDLVICRAGASTIAELAVCGKAAVFIPYPHAAGQHQWINAQKLVDRGAARLIHDQALSGRSLAETILELRDDPDAWEKMGITMKRMGRPEAARVIVDHCYALVQGREIRTGPSDPSPPT